VSQALLHQLPALPAFVGEAAVSGQVSPQPVEGLVVEVGTLLVIQFASVHTFDGGTQGSSTGGVVAMLGIQVVGQFRGGSEGVGEEADGGAVAFLVGDTEQGEGNLLLRAAWFRLANTGLTLLTLRKLTFSRR
jgi:hypothetical protein